MAAQRPRFLACSPRPSPGHARFRHAGRQQRANAARMHAGGSIASSAPPVPVRCPQHAQHARRAQHRRRVFGPAFAAASADRATAPGDSVADAVPQVLAGRSVAVVGGGPGGMLCAAHLARLGAAVEVFELRDPADKSKPAPPARTIGLGPPAARSIAAAGLNPDFGPEWRLEGVAAHFDGRPTMFLGPWAKQPLRNAFHALATQPGIVAHLSAECERVYGAAVTVTHGMRAVGGAVTEGHLVLEEPDGAQHERRFDMVVGADGVNSVVRQLIQEQARCDP